MPEEQALILHMHELLQYLNRQVTMTFLTVAQHGLVGDMKSPVDVTYLADTVILLRYFEAIGTVRRAISVIKKRTGMHESTISRVTSNKYIATPRGIFEMKYFFTAGLQTSTGSDVSNTSVKDMITEIFKTEDAGKPLADQEVVKMLADKGITIARRTVAKYRTELNILPSNLRKVY